MEQNEKPIDNIKSSIMACLYCCLDPISLETGIVEALATGYPVEFGKIALNQLLLEELVKEKSGDISLTSKGYKIIQNYGNYREYLNALEKRRIDKEKEKQLDSKVKKSTILSNYLNATSAICSIVGFRQIHISVTSLCNCSISSCIWLMVGFFEVFAKIGKTINIKS